MGILLWTADTKLASSALDSTGLGTGDGTSIGGGGGGVGDGTTTGGGGGDGAATVTVGTGSATAATGLGVPSTFVVFVITDSPMTATTRSTAVQTITAR